jgi:NAD(P)-dependent dehydrogenase (short-subunit alcohol dehydrogenase family)
MSNPGRITGNTLGAPTTAAPGPTRPVPGRARAAKDRHASSALAAALLGFFAPCGIGINAICPGTIETPIVIQMIDSGDLDRAEAPPTNPSAVSAARRR